MGFASRLSGYDIAALEAAGERRRYDEGAALCHEGDHSDWVALLLAGRVKVCTEDRGKTVVLAVRSPGDLVGELSVFDHAPRSATLLAAEPVDALLVSGDRFRDLLGQRPGIAVLMLEHFTRRVRSADRRRMEFGPHDTVCRVARRLVELAELHGETTHDAAGIGPVGVVQITLPLSQVELAGWTGASRDAVSRALASLRRKGLVQTERGSIVVLDPAGLRRVT